MNYTAQVIDARKNLNQRLDDILDATDKDKNLSPEIKDKITYLRCNEASELASIALKFRQQLQGSKGIYLEVERAIRFLEYSIQHYSHFLNVNRLFITVF